MNGKHITILIASFAGASVAAQAQSWCPPGARWVYSDGAGAGTTITYAGDTIVDGYAGQRFTQFEVMQLPWDPDSIISSYGAELVTRTEPDLVLYWLTEHQVWDTLHWFGALPGDRWSPGWEYDSDPPDPNCLGSYIQVVDTGSMVIDGITLRTWNLEKHLPGDQETWTCTVIERVGNAEGFFILAPPTWCTPTDGQQSFSCYADDEIRYPPSTFPCGSTTAVVELGSNKVNGWEVIPMPFTDHFTVHGPVTVRQGEVGLLDLTGREVLRVPFQGSLLEVNANGLLGGIYLLRVQDGQGRSSHRKVIKE
ncbi:MAG: T9SS type A sorting domain-containing protein [Bacteroidetes bacterium]|nr:T9SS type A sorting domain-containing protein [Bacteroidota bacterium]MBS1943410.1 T9SS type A sorting domain-containing protein [Bacteroidota bacterium]